MHKLILTSSFVFFIFFSPEKSHVKYKFKEQNESLTQFITLDAFTFGEKKKSLTKLSEN